MEITLENICRLKRLLLPVLHKPQEEKLPVERIRWPRWCVFLFFCNVALAPLANTLLKTNVCKVLMANMFCILNGKRSAHCNFG